MSEERRCPSCGGLVGADAEWCTQCFTRLDEAGAGQASSPAAVAGERGVATDQVGREREAPSEAGTRPAKPDRGDAGEAGERLIHSRGDRIVWSCPSCGTENPIDLPVCSACGTPFRQVLREPEEPVEVDPGRAAMFSLIFPGVGHFLARRRGEGIARAVVFAFAMVTGLVSLGAVTGGSGGAAVLLMVLSLSAAAALYVVSTIDAGRAASREPPLLPPRVLLYGGIGLMLATLAVVVIGAMGARG